MTHSIFHSDKTFRGFFAHPIRRQAALFGLTLFIGVGLFALDRLPSDMILFRGASRDPLSFFRAPIDQFYISVFFSWIDFLKGYQALGYLLALSAVLALFDITRSPFPGFRPPVFLIAAAHVILFLYLLPKASLAYPTSWLVTLLFLFLFLWARMRLAGEMHPRGV
ncbi:MAG: hypothetical protein HY472_00935 [Candidatus Sungbacteria bacterium]|nr:hypothetical protein [Candidatus Sungbacteria bacterium]